MAGVLGCNADVWVAWQAFELHGRRVGLQRGRLGCKAGAKPQCEVAIRDRNPGSQSVSAPLKHYKCISITTATVAVVERSSCRAV